MALPSPQADPFELIAAMKFPGTPVLAIGSKLLVKHEGLGGNLVHKYRSFAYLFEKVVRAGNIPKGIAERSSGSMAMAGSILAHAFQLPSKFIMVGQPHPFVRNVVESNGGSFVSVANNRDRRAKLQEFVKEGFWSPDQHNNPLVIEAFAETLGTELVADLHRLGMGSESLAFVVAAVGTGGTLAGVTRKLRQDGWRHFRAVAVDSTTSIVSGGASFQSVLPLAVPGVGSVDEICRTYQIARQEFQEFLRATPLEAVEESARFKSIVPQGCGLSSGLALSVVYRDLIHRCDDHQKILTILPDDNQRYVEELKLFSPI